MNTATHDRHEHCIGCVSYPPNLPAEQMRQTPGASLPRSLSPRATRTQRSNPLPNGRDNEPFLLPASPDEELERPIDSAQQTRAEHLIQALVGLYKENASTLTPDPLYSAFYDSHPPAPVRIAHLNAQT